MSASSTLPDRQPLSRHQHRCRAAPAAPAGPADGARSQRDVGELCRQFAAVCESAVDPLEICSALEFEGWSDQAVREHYGLADVFALAEEMYRAGAAAAGRTGAAAGSVAD